MALSPYFLYFCIVKSTTLRLLQLASATIVCAVALFFPIDGTAQLLLKLAVVWVVSYFSYKWLCPCNNTGYISLQIIWTILATGLIVNTWYFTTYSGGTLTEPVLQNNDALSAWKQMEATLAGMASPVESTRRGYGTFLALISWLVTPAIDNLLCINMVAVLLSIILTAAVAARMVPDYNAEKATRMATAAIILLGSVCYYLITGVILIKDATCSLAMATILYALYGSKNNILRYTLLVVCIVFLALVRPNLLVFITIAMCIAATTMPRSTWGPITLLSIAACTAFVVITNTELSQSPFDFNDGTTNFIMENGAPSERLNAYSKVSDNYMYISNPGKVLRLPFSLAVQYLTPLPWAFSRDIIFGPAQAYAHFAFPWYAVGCILLFYLFFHIRKSPRTISAAFTFGVIGTIAIAYITGGTVSRYVLPLLPFMIPAGAWIVVSDKWRSKAFRLWSICYSVAIIAALTVCFIFLSIYSPGGWEAR